MAQGKHSGKRPARGCALIMMATILLLLLAACGSPNATTGGGVVQPAATPTTAQGGKGGIDPLVATPGPSTAPISAAPSARPATATAPASPVASAAPSVSPSAAPAASAAPSASPSAAPSAPPASSAPSAAPSQAPASIPATGQACPDAHPWAAYTGPEGEKWFRGPQSVAIFYRQPPALCFASEAAARAAGYLPDPRPARATESPDGTCPKENPVKGFTDAQGRQVYLSPGEPGHAAQQATDCFSDTGIAEYFGFKPAATASAAPSASPKPSAAPSPAGSPRPGASPLPSGGALALSPVTLDLGVVSTGTTPATRTITMTYTGPGFIFLKSIEPQLTGPHAQEFAAKLDKCTGSDLADGGTCTFLVTFTPKGGPGERNATLSILVNGTVASSAAALKGTAK